MLALAPFDVVSAEEFHIAGGTVAKIYSYGSDRPSNPAYLDFALIKIENGTIISGSAGTCDNSNFAIPNSEKNMYSAVLSARISSTPIGLRVEKGQTYGGTFCRVVSVEL